jgi:SNF2 family DNA or RNA helicase
LFTDVRTLPPDVRYAGAEAARAARDVRDWPQLSCWNSAPCAAHAAQGIPQPLCRQCGVILRQHQRVGAMWMYLAGKGLLGDSVGTGKTAQVAATLALCREAGELGTHCRTIVVCQPSAIRQWAGELHRMIPELAIICQDGRPEQRVRNYVSEWEVAILSAQTLIPARGPSRVRSGDIQYLDHFQVGLVVVDDVDALRNLETRIATTVCQLADRVPRVLVTHGTPVQKRLDELYCFLRPVGGHRVLGTLRQFRHNHVSTASVVYSTRDRTGRKVERVRERDIDAKDPVQLRWLIGPLTLRRQASDITDARLPDIIPQEVWLDPLPAQRARYTELLKGVLLRLRESGEEISYPEAMSIWLRGWQVCSGLATLDDGQDVSVKLDWLEDVVTGDLADEKIVAFINFKPNVAAMSRRLDALGVGHVVLWGAETGAREREGRRQQFMEDPACRVLLGTSTMERSLNLQAARHMVAVDTIMNPARMTQIVGRIRRTGSPWQSVYFHQLLLRGTQEDAIPARLAAEQGIADVVWDEAGEMFQGQTGRQILEMMVAGRRS